MSIKEFDNTGWVAGLKCRYEDRTYWITNLNTKERLCGLMPDFMDPYSPHDREICPPEWVRCESITLLP